MHARSHLGGFQFFNIESNLTTIFSTSVLCIVENLLFVGICASLFFLFIVKWQIICAIKWIAACTDEKTPKHHKKQTNNTSQKSFVPCLQRNSHIGQKCHQHNTEWSTQWTQSNGMKKGLRTRCVRACECVCLFAFDVQF